MFLFRKTKYFYKGLLDWDDRSSAGRYVRDNCKPLKVNTVSTLMLIAFGGQNCLFLTFRIRLEISIDGRNIVRASILIILAEISEESKEQQYCFDKVI